VEFRRFLSERDQDVLVDALGNFYLANGSWRGVDDMLEHTPPLNRFARGVVLTNEAGIIVYGGPPSLRGVSAPADLLDGAVPITEEGETVGRLIVTPLPGAQDHAPPNPIEIAFMRRVIWAAAVAALVTALVALLLGWLLARTLTRPVSELTAATQAMAAGDLGRQVTVHSRDEIGELGHSFNRMSSDLARSTQARRQMTADLAHDLRTPLSILRGYMEGLADGRLQGSPTLFDVMYGEVDHLQRLVDDLRVLSLADAGELTLNRRAVDPAALLERAGLAYFDAAEQQGDALRIEAGENLPSIDVDTDRMAQVLNNLVSNALRHTRDGEIVLAAWEEGGEDGSEDSGTVVLQVRDTGEGIDPDDLPFVFDRFYRADKSRQRSEDAPHGGAAEAASGLGLAIVKAIVEAHGGSVTVASAPEQGTAFTMTLPANGRDRQA
jgi:two-component system sensor histidine kinase BaeS